MTGEGCTPPPQHKPILTLAHALHLPGTKCFDPFATRLNPPGAGRERGCAPRCTPSRHPLRRPPETLQSLLLVRDAEQTGWSRMEVPKSGGAQLPPPDPPSPDTSSGPMSAPLPTPDLLPMVQRAPALPHLRDNAADSKELDPKNLPVSSPVSLPSATDEQALSGFCARQTRSRSKAPRGPAEGAGGVWLAQSCGRARGARGIPYHAMAEGTASTHTPHALPAVSQLRPSLHRAKRSPQADPVLGVSSASFR